MIPYFSGAILSSTFKDKRKKNKERSPEVGLGPRKHCVDDPVNVDGAETAKALCWRVRVRVLIVAIGCVVSAPKEKRVETGDPSKHK